MLLKHGADQTHRAFGGQHTALEFIQTQKANTTKYLAETTTEETRGRIRASLTHKDAVIDLLLHNQNEQDGAHQPATSVDSKAWGREKLKQEPNGRSQ